MGLNRDVDTSLKYSENKNSDLPGSGWMLLPTEIWETCCEPGPATR